MPSQARAMSVSERHPDEAFSAQPQPKINIPPPLELRDSISVAPSVAEPAVARSALVTTKSAIRWDARFGLSLIALLVIVNLSLVLLFAKPSRNTLRYGPGQRVAERSISGGLTTLAPASGAVTSPSGTRRTTTYISSSERKALLEQLNRTRQPGIVSVPPAAPRSE